MPENVEQIGYGVFRGAETISEIRFMKNCKLQVIRSNAFAHSSIQQITIPASVQRVEDYAFYVESDGGGGVRKLEFEQDSQLAYIGASAFQHCNIKNTVYLPDSVQYISVQAFMPSGRIIEYRDDDAVKTLEVVGNDGSSANKIIISPESSLEMVDTSAFFGCNLGDLVIPKNMVRVNGFDYAHFRSVTLTEKVEVIDEGAFQYSTIKNGIDTSRATSLQTIESMAFLGCKVEKIIIPESVKKIKAGAFGESPVKIYTEIDDKPKGWHKKWSGGCKVVWGSH